ncbi:MAG: type II secretion system GspH family protein [Saccharofermentans sp.]|nr:type II secretion system GspH family protein [Saccharofermentans sp.]
MRKLKKTYNKKGFTLSELLITIVIMSFVGVGAVGGIALILRIHNSTEQKNNALILMTVTEQTLSRSLNRQDSVTLVSEDTGTKYHIAINGVPLVCSPDPNIDDGSYITVDGFMYTAATKVYEYDLVVYSATNNEILRQHIFIHVSAR